VTVDFDGVESDGPDTVTVRYRDDMTQDRVAVDQLSNLIHDKMKGWSPE